MCKDNNKDKKTKTRNNALSYLEFKVLMSGLSNEDINRFCDLILTLQQKP